MDLRNQILVLDGYIFRPFKWGIRLRPPCSIEPASRPPKVIWKASNIRDSRIIGYDNGTKRELPRERGAKSSALSS